MYVTNKVDFGLNRNLMIASVVVILGVGMETSGISIPIGDYALPGMATSTLVGIIMNLILPMPEKEKEEEKENAAKA
jgi:uracil permease